MGMQFIDWQSSYFINVPEIDLQHQEIFVLLGKLYDAMACGEADAVQNEIVQRLVRYTLTHFRDEERLMRECGYPKLEEHIHLHQHLASQVQTAAARIAAGESIVTIGLLRFIKDWFLNHIGQSDRQIAPYIAKRRVA